MESKLNPGVVDRLFVLGLQGSPRKKGNTHDLLSAFMDRVAGLGAKTMVIPITECNIRPCIGCEACSQTGFCFIQDDMSQYIYKLLRMADVIVMATPMYFYNTPAQLKTLIDRSQAFWVRKYYHGLSDPKHTFRIGLLLAQGATKGKNLFDGVRLTAKYFFDAVGATLVDALTYRRIEHSGDIKNHPTLINDIDTMVTQFITPLISRKRFIFTSDHDGILSQIATAFTLYHAGKYIEAISTATEPKSELNPMILSIMAEKKIDMRLLTCQDTSTVISKNLTNQFISLGNSNYISSIKHPNTMGWLFNDQADFSLEILRTIRDEIERQVLSLAESFKQTNMMSE
ncbi:MAG: NAD(P)H-dependent oxidoreductase [Desulfobacterales bacterium]|nr:NAD(P)H-dependent oxidoreductase [Desulfobacterales bacterium]